LSLNQLSTTIFTSLQQIAPNFSPKINFETLVCLNSHLLPKAKVGGVERKEEEEPSINKEI